MLKVSVGIIQRIVFGHGWKDVGGPIATGAPGEGGRLYARDAAVKVLRETGAPCLTWGDERLFRMIADLLGWEYEGPATMKRIQGAISKHPGPLVKSYTRVPGWRQRILVFRLPTAEVTARAG